MNSAQQVMAALEAEYDFNIFNDFMNFTTAQDGWTSLAADGGSSVAAADARGGLCTLTTGATDNNECAVRTTNELFLATNDRPMYGVGYLATSDVNTDDGNLFFGFADALAANTITDDGGAVRASGMIYGIYKLDSDSNGRVWRFNTRNGTAVTDTVSSSTVTSSVNTYQKLEIFVNEMDSLRCTVTAKVDNMFLRNITSGLVIEHRVLYASGTEQNFGFYIKTGDATPGSLIARVDWMGAGQRR